MPAAPAVAEPPAAAEEPPVDLHAPLTDSECQAMFELFDKDANGTLDELEVVQMIKIIKGTDQVDPRP